jgi:hypothetical protein
VSIALYFDENVNGILITALLQRRVDLLTVQADGLMTLDDSVVFARSIQLGRVLVSNDEDMMTIAANHIDQNIPFPGLIFLYRAPVRTHLESLEYLTAAGEPAEFANSIWFLPL